MRIYNKTNRTTRKYFSIDIKNTFAIFYFTIKDYFKMIPVDLAEGAYEYEIVILCFHFTWGRLIDISQLEQSLNVTDVSDL